jgi:Domain of unknown function (DUF4274)
MNKPISPARKNLLAEKSLSEPDKEFFDTITDPVEYHYIASIFNWDAGIELLSWIINNPICDAGTAKMIFWRSQPSYYTIFSSVEEAEHHSEIFILVRSIIENFQNRFYMNQNIFYDPNADPSAEETAYQDPEAEWEIPDFMKESSPGVEINFE